MTSKTANAFIRYHPERVVGVIDRRLAGRTVESILGFGGSIPIVGTMAEGLALGPDAVMIGIAPIGGRLPEDWKAGLLDALDAGCDVWSGLHTFLSDDPQLAARAKERGCTIHDLRRPPPSLPVASGRARHVAPFVILTVGTDCNVGKMTAQLQLTHALNQRGIRTRFVPTGQTGILIEGWGTGVDAVAADFIAGATEELVLKAASDQPDVILVEGQGSLNHPGYSGVTLGLVHGACPDALVLCHQAGRSFIGEYREAEWTAIPPLSAYIEAYELVAGMVHPTRVIGIALNTVDCEDEEARAACEQARDATGLPVNDLVRYGDNSELVDAVEEALQNYRLAREDAGAV